MPTLSITKNYQDGEPLTKEQLDTAYEDVETFVNVTKLDGDNIQTGGITASTKLAAGSITSAKIADAAVTTAKIADDAVTAAKLAADTAGSGLSQNVSTGALDVSVDNSTVEINSDAIRIKDGGIGTAKIAANAVTRAKQEAVGHQVSSAASQTISAVSYTDVTDLTVTITTSGRPVIVMLIGNDEASVCQMELWSNSGTGALVGRYQLLRDSTSIAQSYIRNQVTATGAGNGVIFPPPGIVGFDQPAAGTYTYKIQALVDNTNWRLQFTLIKLVAYEL